MQGEKQEEHLLMGVTMEKEITDSYQEVQMSLS